MSDQSQGQDSPKESQGGAPSSISVEDMNRAITARFAAYEKKLEGKLTESFGGFESKLTEILSAKLEESKPKADAAEAKPLAIEDTPQYRSMQKQLSEIKNAFASSQAKQAEAEARSRDVQLRQQLGEQLSASGIDAARLKHAVGYLVDAEKRVKHGEDGSIVFADSNGEPLDMATGLKAWVTSDDAKLYLSPRGAVGSGDKNVQAGNRGNAPTDPNADAKAALMAHFGVGG